ncbi:MAG TPA: ParA family protein [Polyangiaceae bacterium]|nr:ParA family protein [Polyangiaceae bacterium]
MATLTKKCTICGSDFEPHFSYQMEEREERDADGVPTVRFAFFCSQDCLERSHRGGDDGTVCCDACATGFRVELASQVVFSKGRRRYACGPECRAMILAEARGARLGEALAPAAAVNVAEPAAAVPPAAVPPAAVPPAAVPPAAVPPAAVPPTAVPPAAPPVSGVVAPAATAALPAPTPLVREPAPRRSAHVLAIFNHKGGTGKTTTAVTIAAGLAARGKRVLLVDTDGQGNVAVSLGLKQERSLYHVLVMNLPVAQAVVTTAPGFDILPSNETLAAAELYLAGKRQRDRVLAARLADARQSYDFIVVDCSPSLSLMNQNALVFADAVLCPVACDYLSLVGVRQVVRTIKSVNRLLGHPVRLWGVLPTLFDGRARICHEALQTLREHFGDRCLPPVRVAIKVKEAPAQGKTLLDYAPTSTATSDYLAVVDRLLADTEAQDTEPRAACG